MTTTRTAPRCGQGTRNGSALRVLLVAFCGALIGGCLIATSALAALPEGRVYEQVSPEFKAGYGVLGRKGLNAISLDGERVEFTSIGAFAHAGEDHALNGYAARRTSEGWVTEALFPRVKGECVGGLEVFSPDLSRFELVGSVGATATECSKSPTDSVWVREPDGSLSQVSPSMTTAAEVGNGLGVLGGSSDLGRLVFARADGYDPTSRPPIPDTHVLPGEINDETVDGSQLYETEGLHAKFVGVDNKGIQLTTYCNVYLGGNGGLSVGAGKFGAVSQPAASEVFFSVSVNSRESSRGKAQCEEASHPEQLFVRVAGAQTLEVSKPLGEACPGGEMPCPNAGSRAHAVFQGASEDGAIVYFTMADTAGEPLVPGNKDHSNNLYVATIGCAGGMLGEACGSAPREVVSMELASPDSVLGQGAEVQREVLAISPNGSHAYFVAHGVLNEAANEHGETAVAGAENLYVYDRSTVPAKVSYIADLCSGPELSGSVRDVKCPSSLAEGDSPGNRNDHELWIDAGAHEGHEAQTTPDGRYLLFGTFARLIGSGSEADTDSSEDVYRYDSQTGVLRRVSVAGAGQEGNGNGPFDAHIAVAKQSIGRPQEEYELGDRAVTEDGSRIVFTTSERLSESDATLHQDVYVWNEGHVGMVSCGCSTEDDEEPVITPSGNDVIFLTTAGLVPSDTDGLADLYDARVNGGFPKVQAPTEPCLADACYGPLSTPAPILVPGSVTQPAGGNVPAPSVATAKTVAKTKRKAKKRKKTRKRRAKAKRSSAQTHRNARSTNGRGRG